MHILVADTFQSSSNALPIGIYIYIYMCQSNVTVTLYCTIKNILK